MNGLADTIVGAAATNVCRSWLRRFSEIVRRTVSAEQGRCAHHLAALAITALGNAHFDPGLLHLFSDRILGNRFDSRYLSPFRRADRGYTGSDRLTVHVHGASAAKTHPTAKFSSSKSQDIAYCPQQGHIVWGIQAVRFHRSVESFS